MHPKSKRRVHGAELKFRVLAECRQPGASVAAVSLAHRLNVNLVRKWMVGRGLKRVGLAVPKQITPPAPPDPTPGPMLQFVPVELASPVATQERAAAAIPPRQAEVAQQDIVIELRRGSAQLTVRWSSSQARACAAWLSELAGAALK
jgi:transposase